MGSRRACVIGSGFGGLSAAIRLQAQGFETHLYEKRDLPGGRAYVFKDKGYTFDAGPTVITAPHCIEELFEVAGKKMSDYVTLMTVEPFYRLQWEDGYKFDYGSNLEETLSQIRTHHPSDEKGYLAFLQYSKKVFEAGYIKLVHTPFLSVMDMVRVAPKLLTLQAYKSVYQKVSQFIKSPKLREAFSFHSLLVGGNPFSASSIYTLIHYLERNWGVTFPKGGTGALVNGLVRLFRDIGGTLHLSTPIKKIRTSNGSVIGIETEEGALVPFDLVVSNADVVHTYESLLKGDSVVKPSHKKALKMSQSMSLFLIYFGTRRQYPEVAHHTVLFGSRYRELLNDIFNRKELAKDFSLYLHRPTKTDSSLAPEGCDSFYVLAPVPNLSGAKKINWEETKERYADTILKYLEKYALPDLSNQLESVRLFTPNDFKTELNAHHGSAFSFEPTLIQSAYFRTHNRDRNLVGLYFVGAGTHPGAGLPGVINSAKATASVIMEDFAENSRSIHSRREAVLSSGSKTFRFASSFFSRKTFKDVATLYSWLRYCDDQIDEAGRGGAHLCAEGHPAFDGYKNLERECDIPAKYVSDFIEGMNFDSKNPVIEDEAELKKYCYWVAGTVGATLTYIFLKGRPAPSERVLKRAMDLGIAMQMTNIARDIREDAVRGRVYLPKVWLIERNLSPNQLIRSAKDDLAWAQVSDEVSKLAARLISVAEPYYTSGRAGLKSLPLRIAFAVGIALELYRAIGFLVVNRGAAAWNSRTSLNKSRKVLVAIKGVKKTVLSFVYRRGVEA